LHNKPLVLKLLGTPEATWNGAPVALPRRQARAVLYRLATELQPVTRDALLLLLWPDSAETTARRNLTRLLSYLRSALPDSDILQTTRAGVLLNPDLVTSDAVDFSRHIAVNDESAWEASVALVRGPFLDGFALPTSYEFDSWLSTRQQQYERHYLTALSRLVTAKKAVADYPAAIRYARHYLQSDDLAEEIHRQLIILYAATGQRSAALRQFEQCMVVLEHELGVEPLPETRAAYEAARDGVQPQSPPAAAKPVWGTLPGLDLPLIGRESAWEEIAEAYSHSRSGGVILISGTAGVGKSRLMQEFATAQNSLVLTGNTHADGQTLPYQPLVQALRQALPLRERWRHAAPIWLAEASRLMPELAVHFPGLPQPVDVDVQQAQVRLFEALTQLFRSLATDTPLLLCLDDIHWADKATRGWLQYASDQLAASHICLLATYRTDEAAELRAWQRTVARAGLVSEVRLEGLTVEAVAALLRETKARIRKPHALAKRVQAATGGNAFFVLETVRELLETGQLANPPADLPLPSTVRDAVLRRAGRLTPLTQQVLEVTAVLSPTLTAAVISKTAGRDELETIACLEELVTHHLLADEAQLRFHHALAREVVYQNISAWRRQLLHRRAANVLAKLPSNENGGLAAIAIHFEAAGKSGEAIDYYQKAATVAESVYAHQEAIGYLNRAIELANEVAGTTAVLPQLHETLAYNLTSAGDFVASEEAYRKALELVPEDNPLQLAELKRKLAGTLPPQQRADEAESVYRAAIIHLDGPSPTAVYQQWQSTRLNILLGLLDALYLQFRPEAMAKINESIQALLDEVGTAEQQAHYYSRLNQMAFLQNRYRAPSENVALAQKALAYAQESGSIRLIARQQFHLGFHLLWHGDLNDACEMLLLALVTAKELGDSWLQNQCLVYLTILYRIQGNTTQVAAHLPHLVEISQQVGNSLYIGVSQANTAWLHYRAGEWQQALTQAEAAIASWADTMYPFQWLAYWPLLATALWLDRPADAVAAARAMLDSKQQQLPDEVDEVLEMAVAVWQSNDETTARSRLETAAELAAQYGYL
jgi:DNA-binding SARP family transcriptional activator